MHGFIIFASNKISHCKLSSKIGTTYSYIQSHYLRLRTCSFIDKKPRNQSHLPMYTPVEDCQCSIFLFSFYNRFIVVLFSFYCHLYSFYYLFIFVFFIMIVATIGSFITSKLGCPHFEEPKFALDTLKLITTSFRCLEFFLSNEIKYSLET